MNKTARAIEAVHGVVEECWQFAEPGILIFAALYLLAQIVRAAWSF
jgi:hypothetical protein